MKATWNKDFRIRRRDRGVLLGLLLVLLLGVLDYLSGPEISFAIFYLLPIYLVTWFIGRWPGVIASVISALVWLLADLLAGHAYSHPMIPYWNSLVRLCFFLLTTYLLSELLIRESRRRSLERIFFHDVLNVATSIRGFTELLKDYGPSEREQIFAAVHEASEQIIDEIEAQRTLSAAENHELQIEPAPVGSRGLLERLADWYGSHDVARNRKIVLAPDSEEVLFESDPVLAARVLGNLLKNALEATPAGATVTMGCRAEEDGILFWVHNAGLIPDEVRSRIFRPFVSTKGRDRGLGTYSIRILSDYLHGKVSFTSTEQEGTTFRVRFPLHISARGY